MTRFVPAILFCLAAAFGEVTPSALFSDHMVLQSGMAVPVWGTASPGEQVTVAFNGQKRSIAASDGRWMVRLSELKPGGPYQMTIAGTNTITINDVLVGEVWIGSGQSNMVFPMSKARMAWAGVVNEEQEIAAANYPRIRMFTVKEMKSYEPQAAAGGQWQICSPENAPGFSAIGYFFARDLQKELKVPVGIVVSAYGASTAEAWISRDAMAADPLMKPMLDGLDAAVKFYRADPKAPASEAPKPPATINARPGPPRAQQRDPVADQHYPIVMYNGMVHPIIPYAMRGVLWYQGESIVGGEAGVALYGHVHKALIRDWRQLWGQGDFPFYLVQLPGQKNISNNPLIREGQADVLSLKNTGMAVSIDVGEADNVHPRNKAPVANRLVRIALANVFGRKIAYSGPVYESMKADGERVVVKFSRLGGGLMAKGGPLKWFQVAGVDKKFVDAEAKIEGDSVILTSAAVKEPVAVRYAWDNYPEGANLFNAAGLPAAPFRTDNWEYHY